MSNTFCIGTLNVHGLDNKFKRRALFNQLRKRKIDIACLQETYVKKKKKDTIQDVKREWKGKIFYTIGTSRSNGLLIFIDTKLLHEEIKLVKETDRISIIQIIINNTTHRVVYCFAPNITAGKKII